MEHNPDPTDHMALNENHEANIGGKPVPCTPVTRRAAIRGLINEEDPSPLRGYSGKRLHPRRRSGNWSSYTWIRSGIRTAWYRAIDEANPGLDRGLLFMMTGLYVPEQPGASRGPQGGERLPEHPAKRPAPATAPKAANSGRST